MSVGSQELDRSILERKDRDELVAIAEAFGQKPASRAKKADIVDLILDLTGVGTDGSGAADAPAKAGDAAESKPRRARTRNASKDGEASDGDPAGGASPDAGSAPAPAATNGAADRGDGAAEVAEAPTSTAEKADDAEKAGNAEKADDAGKADNAEKAADLPAAVEQDGPSKAGAPDKDHDASRQGGGDGGSGQGEARQRGDEAEQRQGGQQQSKDQDQQGNGQDQQGKNQNQNGQNQNGQNQQGRQHQGGGKGGGQNVPGDAEPGNRRRRRRNRDRDRDQRNQPEEVFQGEPIEVAGLLDLRDEGYGFLRLKGYLPSKDDVYVSVKQVRQFSLRKGDHLKGASRPATRNEKNPALLRIDEVNGQDPEKARQRPRFEDLTPLFPDEKLRLEVDSDPTNMTARIVDLLSPIGKGQRGLIVSPPKAGKTTVMKTIARSIETNNPEAHLIVLLVDERPEEVTDFRRWLKRGEVAASTFDRPSDEHTHVAELVIERAKRMVEEGKDVVIILDGITRLARAYNLAAPASGRIMSGGIDAGALYPPKKFFGAARNVEEGGSLTILATALVETNSRMDDHIFEEFKGTGNMELKLDRKLADRRIYPAIDVDASGTRHEELLFERRQLQQVWKLRRVLSGLSADGGTNAPGLELLVDRMKTFKSNDEFLAEIAKAPSVA